MKLSIVKKIVLGASFAVVILLAVLFVIDLRQRTIETPITEADLLPVLQDGDIICRLGDRIWSLVFKEFSPHDKRYSHLGIVVIQDGTINIINAEGSREENNDKVQIVSLQEFLRFARNVGVYRAKAIDGNSIASAALDYVDRPFDWDFDMDDDSKLYCTELVYVTLKKLSNDLPVKTIWVKELSKNIIPVDICSDTQYFTEIGHYGN